MRPTVFSRFTASSQMCMPRDSSTSTCPRYCRGEMGEESVSDAVTKGLNKVTIINSGIGSGI